MDCKVTTHQRDGYRKTFIIARWVSTSSGYYSKYAFVEFTKKEKINKGRKRKKKKLYQ